jgi:Low molecular weight phosphotyrosine protein phosphatase
VPAASAGTHPARAIAAGAIAAAERHHLPLRRLRPRHIDEVQESGDLIVTLCDMAHEELGQLPAIHWSVPDPVPAGDPGSFDAALAELRYRVERFAPRLAAAPWHPFAGLPAAPATWARIAAMPRSSRDHCLPVRAVGHPLGLRRG